MRGAFIDDKLAGHVLICGWNSSAPGIIYSLTSKHAPKLRRVVVVADIDGEMPLSEYGFHPKLVFYIKGDSACMETLRKARAEYASEALVLAGDKKLESQNIGSILTVIALRKLTEARNREMKTKLFVGVELRYIENMSSFIRAGADEILNTQLLSDRIAALSLLSPEIPDYIVDFLTYDKFYELYSDKVLELPNAIMGACSSNQLTDQSYDYRNLEQRLMANGIHLFGITRNVGGSDYDTVLFANEEDSSFCVYSDDRIVYFSDSKSDIRHIKSSKIILSADDFLPEIGELKYEYGVAIVGRIERLNEIKMLMKEKFTSVVLIRTSEFMSIVAQKDQRERQNILMDKLDGIQSILILCESKGKHEASNFDYSDTTSLLIIEELNALRSELNLKINIIAETEDYKSREIFIASGVDQIIPSRIFLERVLAKMVFNHGRMYEFLLKLVTVDDGVYLRSYKVKKGDYFVGRDIKELMLGRATNYKICGWLPLKNLPYLENKTMGFSHHFITAFNNKQINHAIGSTQVEVGDTLILLYFEACH